MKKITLAFVLSALSLASVGTATAEEGLQPLPPRYEIGGNVNNFDPKTSTITIDGKPYVITSKTTVWIEDDTGNLSTLPLVGFTIPEGTSVYYELAGNGQLLGVLIKLAASDSKETKR
ncbi:MAG: hypothetical protein B7Y40_09200 [Gammaproteobacteria bacterium 28-57-27]|nr:MAG: hypothetical protein B7Y40_09200 [Gammaproteobacteria bacterium 28-57-27]